MLKPKPIQRRLLEWYARHGRDLPWRRTQDPYAILVSEVMLQQTQVDRVIPKYQAWLKRWPTVESLARARTRAVLQAWSGLGYNRRALNLQRAAQAIVRDHHGRVPSQLDELNQLSGIGPYTAAAVAVFAFRQPVSMIDTNVRRVVSRLVLGVKPNPAALPMAAAQLVPATAPDAWHHAVMDLGATICVSRRPKCEICPLQKYCRAYPAILHQPTQRSGVAKPKFETTDRFWRGRILARLLETKSSSQTDLANYLAKSGRLARRRLTRLLSALAREGLIQKEKQTWSVS